MSIQDSTAPTRTEELQARAETFISSVPMLRGVSHAVAFFVAVLGGVFLVMEATLPAQHAAALIYSLGMSLSLGTSAAYHRLPWSKPARRLMRKMDHAMIFVFVGSTYTPIALLALEGNWRTAALVSMWAASLCGVAARFGFKSLSRRTLVGMYLAIGWVALIFVPQIYGALSDTSLVLLAAGGLLYTVGALVYLYKRPNPLPRVFGFHEVFHALVIAAAACHYAAVFPLVAG